MNINPERNGGSSLPEIRIGIIGGRSVGKTSFLASMFTASDPETGGTIIVSEKTKPLLATLLEKLNSGERLPASAATGISEFQAALIGGDRRWIIVLHDYAGNLLELLPQPDMNGEGSDIAKDEISQELKLRLEKSFSACDAILLFIPVDLLEEYNSSRAAYYPHIVDTAVGVLLEGGEEAKPFCVALSKWDQLDEKYKGWRDFVEQQPLFRTLQAKWAALGDKKYHVMPVSAFGAHARFDPMSPPEGGICPFNVFESLEYLCVEVDRARRGRLRDAIDKIRSPFFKNLRRYLAYRKARGVIADREAANEIRANFASARRGVFLEGFAAIALLLIAAGGAFFLISDHRLSSAGAAIEQARRVGGDAGLHEALSFMDTRSFAYPRALGLAKYKDFENTLANALENRISEIADDHSLSDAIRSERGKRRVELLNAALAASEGGRRKEFESRLDRERQREKYQDFDSAHKMVLSTPDSELLAQIALFREKYPPANYPMKAGDYKKLDERRRRYVDGLRRQEEKEIADFGVGATPAEKIAMTKSKLEAYARFIVRREKEGLEADEIRTQIRLANQELERLTLLDEFTAKYDALDRIVKSQKDSGRYPASEVDEFLVAHNHLRFHPDYRETMAELERLRDDAKIKLEGRKIADKLSAAKKAFDNSTPNDRREALKKYREIEEHLNKLDKNRFLDERATVHNRLNLILNERELTAYMDVKSALAKVEEDGAKELASAIEACDSYLKLRGEARFHNHVEAWRKYLSHLQGLNSFEVELLYLSVEDSKFAGGAYDRNIGWHYLNVSLYGPGNFPLTAFGGDAPPKAKDGSNIKIESQNGKEYFRMSKSKVELQNSQRIISCGISSELRLSLSEYTGVYSPTLETTGSATFPLFPLVYGKQTGDVEYFTIYGNGESDGPARIGVRFSSHRAPPKPLPEPQP